MKVELLALTPNARTTELVVSANFREYRHIFQVRLHAGAQWEIRAVCREMLAILNAQAPLAFGDLWNAWQGAGS